MIKAIPAWAICFTLSVLYSCTEKIENTINDSYLIELDNHYKIQKITHTDHHGNTYWETFGYSGDHVVANTSAGTPCTYYLNSEGYADSCCHGKFIYSPHGYLLTDLTSGTAPRQHEYSGGNRIKTTWGNSKIYYQFNSLPSFMDIHELHRPFLGRSNKNLISSVQIDFVKASSRQKTTYTYDLDDKGLVVKRTGIRTSYDDQKSREVTTFAYILLK